MEEDSVSKIEQVEFESGNSEEGDESEEYINAYREIERTEPTSTIETDSRLSKGPIYEQETAEEPIHNNQKNARALKKNVSTYQLEKFEKKKLLIFNHTNSDKKLNLKTREGTEKDVKKLTETFSRFGFNVERFDDLTKDEILGKLKQYRKMDFTDYGCLAVAVLTHGSSNGELYAYDGTYNELEFLDFFKTEKNVTLVTKPKILLIQACRGTQPIEGVPVHALAARTVKDGEEEEHEYYTLPLESDILLVHSSYFGKPSHRDTENGTWFIQTLCKEIDNSADKLDLDSILINVKRSIAIDYEHVIENRVFSDVTEVTEGKRVIINKQIPVTTSTFIRKLFLRKFEDNLSSVGYELGANASHADSNLTVEHKHITQKMKQFDEDSKIETLDVFNYYKKCLSYYVGDHPNEDFAKSILAVADSVEEHVSNETRSKLSELMCNFIKLNSHSQYLKYVYIYSSIRETKN